MPQLLIDLESPADCQRGMALLRRRLRRHGCGVGAQNAAEQGGDWMSGTGGEDAPPARQSLPQRLKQIRQRGMWKHLTKIAESAPEPLSLPELDALLDLPKNKMRSLKAIMAKLENRFGVTFLRVDPEAGVDAAGNPRYVMPPRVRKQVLRLANEQ